MELILNAIGLAGIVIGVGIVLFFVLDWVLELIVSIINHFIK